MSKNFSYGSIVKLEGVSRNQRFSKALDPQLVRIDERQLQDFLTYLQQFNSNVMFVDSEGPVDFSKTWDQMFVHQPSFLMARIASKDADEISASFEELHARFQASPSVQNLYLMGSFIYGRFQKMDRWYASVNDHPLEEELALYIRSYLSVELQKLKYILDYLPYGNQSKESMKPLAPLINKNGIWDTEKAVNIADHAFAGASEEEKMESASYILNEVFNSVLYSNKSIINFSKNYFSSGIFESGNHQPHVALFIGFAQLFGYAQEEINKIPARLLDFYYKQVLGVKPKSAVPDQVFLIAELTRGFNQFEIAKDSLLSAGKDDTNVELFYKVDKDVIVTKANVQSIRTLTIIKQDNRKVGYYASVRKRSGTDMQSDKTGLRKSFGEKKGRVAVGFAIASTQFYLAKGDRSITVSFSLKDEIKRDLFTHDPILALRFTGEEGWLDQRNMEESIIIHSLKKTGAKTLELNFSIPISQPSAVVAYDPRIHAGNYSTAFPIMQVLLNFPASGAGASDLIDQVNELIGMRIESITVRVEVGSAVSKLGFNGVSDLQLENHDSVLDATKPFYPFSALPKVGSSFYIGCPDLYYKDVEKFSINIEWMLPDNFNSYYEKYFPPYDSNKFRAALSILKEKKWVKVNDVIIIDTNENEGRFRILRIDMSKINDYREEDPSEPQVSKFDTARLDGTVRLKLLYPDFGHTIYPQLITSTVLEKSTSKSAVVDYYKIVKKQLYDSVISIKMPVDVADRNGSLKIVVYDILSMIPDNQRARSMMINGLTEKLKQFNGSDVLFQDLKSKLVASMSEETENRIVVNDDSFINRMLSFLKNIRLLDRDIHIDKDQQDVTDVALRLKDKISTKSTMILPAHWELASLILTEINTAIKQIVIRIVDEILMQRKNGIPDGILVEGIFKRHVDEANEVINDMIARKIAILLSAHDIPPPPYTPLINSIAINYTSSRTMVDGEDQFFQITPFGIAEIFPLRKTAGKAKTRFHVTDRLFPLTSTEEDPSGEDEGQLFLGLSDLVPLETLSLFFQLEETGMVTDYRLPALSWWYLANNQWYRLPENAIACDTTYGLQTTGIVELNIPQEITRTNTLFDEQGLYWLRVCAADHSEGFPYLIDVRAQAFSATFVDNDNDPAHYAMPLHPFRIKAFAEPMAGIRSLKQPVASLTGKMEEAPEEFYTRVSERLRHKQRAVAGWDYERLLLEEFPFIYKVNCVNNYYRGQFVPGHVTVVPIASLQNKGGDYTTPLTSYRNLVKMEQFLQERSSPFVKVHAVNPEINYVLIRCKVRLKVEKNKGFYLQKLNEELKSFLTPWASTTGESTAYTAKVYLSSVISFIDSRKYVEFVSDTQMNQYKEDVNGNRTFMKAPNGAVSLFETVAMAPHEITASAREHEIELLL